MKNKQQPAEARRVFRSRRGRPVGICLIILAILFSAAGCAGAETEETPEVKEVWGADAFRRYYSQKAETDAGHDYSHMALDVLDDMASGTSGTSVDTDELTIDVAGAVVSGNTAEIILRVTAKTLDSLLYDNGTEDLNNYRFGDESAALGTETLGRSFYYMRYSYSYSNMDEALAPNQLELHYLIITPEPFAQDVLTIPLTDFGYYSKGGAEFVPLYEGAWNVDIALDPAADSSKRISVGKSVTIGDYHFTLDNIQVTPLACTALLVCAEKEKTTVGHMDDIISACTDGSETIALTLADGTVLDRSQLEVGGGWALAYPLYIPWALPFHAPLDVEDVAVLSFCGNDFSLTD